MIIPLTYRWLLWVLLTAATCGRAQDGIFADFVTSHGNFTCQLFHDRAPRTVANFVGLATGERSWLNLPRGEVARTPFFDGLTFHRVVSGFVIQGGSPKGDGTDGPGYTFRDEFDSTLRHSKAGILSMANSGPNSNGSQFFITLAATPFLDDVHSVFGEVTGGMDVVNVIVSVPVDSNSKPITPVIIQKVTIRRVGAAAQAFDVASQGLPVVGGAGAVLSKNGGNYALQFPRALYSEYLLYSSGDLVTWTAQRIGLYISAPPVSDLDVTSFATGKLRQFFRVPQIMYSGPIFTPPAVANSKLVLNLSGGGGTIEWTFNNTGGGTSLYAANQQNPNGSIVSYSWTQEAYRGRSYVRSTNVVDLQLSHVFTSAGGGTFKGTAFTSPSSTPISGTFSFAPISSGAPDTLPSASVSISTPRKTTSDLQRSIPPRRRYSRP
jgi:peptidyl-prolyl cis-trans isomerase A (cyclophilin A)